jgi:hypothetical protein
MASQSRDFEDRLKSQVHQSVLKHRKGICDGCEYKGANNFCQQTFEFLPEFQKYRYHTCPIKKWTENWS